MQFSHHSNCFTKLTVVLPRRWDRCIPCTRVGADWKTHASHTSFERCVLRCLSRWGNRRHALPLFIDQEQQTCTWISWRLQLAAGRCVHRHTLTILSWIKFDWYVTIIIPTYKPCLIQLALGTYLSDLLRNNWFKSEKFIFEVNQYIASHSIFFFSTWKLQNWISESLYFSLSIVKKSSRCCFEGAANDWKPRDANGKFRAKYKSRTINIHRLRAFRAWRCGAMSTATACLRAIT